MKYWTLFAGVMMVLLVLSCLAGNMACDGEAPELIRPPIYVSIVIHNEETAQYVSDPARFVSERTNLVLFADMLANNGVMLNWQSDWRFLRAVDLYDMGGNTGGLNIVEYIASLGFEVDPHAHESVYNYADVAYLIEQLGVTPSGIAGGFIADPPQDSLLEQFWLPITGAQFPAYSWTAEALWGGGTSGHVNEESLWASGVWKPQDSDHFMTHDNNPPVPHIGKYGNTWDDLDLLIDRQQNGELFWNHMYTASVFVRQADLVGPNFIADFQQELQARTGSSDLIWAGLGEIVDIWQNDYNSAGYYLAY
jgi:hypothetical protein